MKYITDITLPVSGEKSYISVPAKQGDAGSRFIRAALYDQNGTFSIPEGATATLSMVKPDGTCVFNAAEIQNNAILAELTGQMLAVSGKAACGVNLFAEDGSMLSSSNFTLEIEKSVHSDASVQSSSEFSALQKAMAQVVNPLYGKTILDFGDSIAYGNDTAGVGYADMIAERNGMTVHSYAVGGHKLSQILAQLQSATEETADYVLLEGGYNDANPSGLTTMGSLSSGYTATLDTTTFCGALETLLKTAQAKYPSAKIVYVIVHRTKRTQWPDYAAAIKAACDKWSVPCVNLMEQGGLNSNIDAMLNAYTDSVGVHPNEAGYLTWYVPPIEAKLRELTLTAVKSSGQSDAYTGTFDIPGVIPDNVRKISQYTVNGLSLEAGSMTAGSQTIALPALGKWDVLTASADGSGTIARQSVRKPLSEISWNRISLSTDSSTVLFGCTTTSQYLPAADLPSGDGEAAACLYSPDFPVMSVSQISGSSNTQEGIACKSTGSLRLRVLASRLPGAGITDAVEDLTAYLADNNLSIIYKAAEQTTESVTLDALTASSGAVSLTDGYSGGTMTAVDA